MKFSERLAVRHSDIVTDNKAIQDYVYQEYGVNTEIKEYSGEHAQEVGLAKSSIQDKKINYEFLSNSYAYTIT